MQRNERGVQRYSSFITVTRLRIDASSHGETANGAAASAKYELVTYVYYVRTLNEVRSTRHLPWAGFGSIWPHRLRLTSDVQKVKIVTPRRNANTPCARHAAVGASLDQEIAFKDH